MEGRSCGQLDQSTWVEPFGAGADSILPIAPSCSGLVTGDICAAADGDFESKDGSEPEASLGAMLNSSPERIVFWGILIFESSDSLGEVEAVVRSFCSCDCNTSRLEEFCWVARSF